MLWQCYESNGVQTKMILIHLSSMAMSLSSIEAPTSMCTLDLWWIAKTTPQMFQTIKWQSSIMHTRRHFIWFETARLGLTAQITKLIQSAQMSPQRTRMGLLSLQSCNNIFHFEHVKCIPNIRKFFRRLGKTGNLIGSLLNSTGSSAYSR